jgi:hypothetical protein
MFLLFGMGPAFQNKTVEVTVSRVDFRPGLLNVL